MIRRLLALCLLISGCSQDDQGKGAPISRYESDDNIVASAPLKLYTFDCGNIEVSEYDVFFSSSGDYVGQAGDLTNTCYLARHPEGDLMRDLGLPSDLVGSAPKVNGVVTPSLLRAR